MPDSASTEPPVTAAAPRPKGLLAASILCWLAGTVIGVLVVSFVVSETRRANPMAMLALVWLPLAAPYCIAGYLLGKARRSGGSLAVLTAALVSAVQLVASSGGAILSPGLFGNLGIILLVVLNWRHLRPLTRQVGA